MPQQPNENIEKIRSGEYFREAWRAYKLQQYEQQLIALRPPVDPTEKVVTQDQIEAWVDEIRSENFKRKQSQK